MFFQKAKNRLQGKPDGSYVYYDASGKETSGWMPLELLTQVLQKSGGQKLTRVLIREPDDTTREDLLPIDEDTVKKFADTDGTVHVMSCFEHGGPKYYFISRQAWDNFDAIVAVMMDPSLSDSQKHARVKSMTGNPSPAPPHTRSKPATPSADPKGKDLSKKAIDAPFALRILMETIRRRLERDYPQVMLCPRWSAFVLAGTVAGTVGLALRLHFEVEEDQRTQLELAMRDVLQKRFPQSEEVYEDCYRFLTESLMDIPRAERGKQIFVLLGLWVLAAVSEGSKVQEDAQIAAQIAGALQNETSGFWTQPYPEFGE